MHSLGTLFDEIRSQFPRLYFVSDEELVSMLGISRNVQQLVPFARKCFPGIVDIGFEVPTTTKGSLVSTTATTNFILNGRY